MHVSLTQNINLGFNQKVQGVSLYKLRHATKQLFKQKHNYWFSDIQGTNYFRKTIQVPML